MKFISTRGNSEVKNAASAISMGLAEDGGLFVPSSFPKVSLEELEKMIGYDYAERAATVLYKYLEEYDYEELLSACKKAFRFEICKAS